MFTYLIFDSLLQYTIPHFSCRLTIIGAPYGLMLSRIHPLSRYSFMVNLTALSSSSLIQYKQGQGGTAYRSSRSILWSNVWLIGLLGLLKTSLNSASNTSHLDAYTGSAVWPCTTLMFTFEPSSPQPSPHPNYATS